MKGAIISKKIKELGLECDNSLYYAPDSYLKRVYNGVGNEALPVEVRRILTKLTRFFTDYPFIIHDYDYQVLNKTKRNFHLSNKRLRNNLKIMLDRKLPRQGKSKWWNVLNIIRRWKRKFYLTQIRIIYFAVEEFGWGAFNKGVNDE